jgi:hypothetical protein
MATLVAGITLLSLPAIGHFHVAAACREVRPGMTFSQMNSAPRAKSSFFYEYADFDRNKYQYQGSDGSCLVVIDPGDRVTKVEFDPPSDFHIR